MWKWNIGCYIGFGVTRIEEQQVSFFFTNYSCKRREREREYSSDDMKKKKRKKKKKKTLGLGGSDREAKK